MTCDDPSKAEYRGFRFPQLISEMHLRDWKAILHTLHNAPTDAAFYREVLAVPWDTSDKLLSEDLLRACCDDTPMYLECPERYQQYPKFAGLDYGRSIRSYTLFLIGCRIGKLFKVLYMKRFRGAEAKPSIYLEHVKEMFGKFDVVAIGCDSGDAHAQNFDLADSLGAHRVNVFFACNPTSKILWFDEKTNEYHFNRTRMMSLRAREIKHRLIRFPSWEYFQEFAPDFLTITVDYTRHDQVAYYDHEPDVPDDAFHALNYAVMSSDIAGGYLMF